MLPLAEVVTPNLPEAAAAGRHAGGRPRPTWKRRRGASTARGPRYVLVKGGHLKDSATDLLYDGRAFTRFPAPRVDSDNTHGTGCTFSAAIAAGLAHGRPLAQAIREAKAYVTRRHPRGLRGRPRGGRAPALRERAGSRWLRTVDDKMPFLEHLGELRTRIVRALIALLVGTLHRAAVQPVSWSTGWPGRSPSSATSWCSRRRPRPSGCR